MTRHLYPVKIIHEFHFLFNSFVVNDEKR